MNEYPRDSHHVHITRTLIVVCDGPRCDPTNAPCPGVDVLTIEAMMKASEPR